MPKFLQAFALYAFAELALAAGVLVFLSMQGCAGSSATRTASEGRPAGDTCSGVTRPGVSAAAQERLEHASNVLDYESVWRAEHPGATAGTISGSEVRARIRSNTAEIRECYETALDRLPPGEARVAVRFVVDSSGQVPAVHVTSSNIQDAEVGCCVAKRVAGWSFPTPTNGGFVVVEYPFVVRTSKSK